MLAEDSISGSGHFATDGVGPPSGAPDQIFITVGHLRSSCCGRVCNLIVQFAVTLRSKSHRTHDHILLSHLRLPQPRAPGPCIYIPQEQVDPVIPPSTEFPFCRLLRLAGLRWRHSNPPPHGLRPSLRSSQSQSQSYITTDSLPVSWYQAPTWDPRPIFPILSLIIFFFLQFRVCWCGAPFPTRRRVCTFQSLSGNASAAFLKSESHGTHEHSLYSLFFIEI
jgi:hypothetical protein